MLSQKLSVSIIAEIIIYFLGFVSLIFVVRLLGPKPLGLVASALAISNIFSIIGNLGFGVSHVKMVSQGEDLNKCISTFLFIKLFTIPLMIISFFIFSIIFPHSNLSYYNFEDKSVLIVFLLVAVIGSLSDIGNFTLSAQLRVAIGKAVLVVQKLLSSIGKIIVALLSLSAFYLASVELFATIVVAICYFYIFRKVRITLPSKEDIKKYFSFGLPALVITITSILMSNNIDRVILTNFAGTEEVGFYSAALSLMVFFSFIANNLNNLLFPHFSKLFSNNNKEEVRIIAHKAERLIIILIFPITLLIFFNSREIVLILFGEKMLKSASIISFFSLQFFIFLLNKPFSTQIMAAGKFNLAVYLDLSLLFFSTLFLLLLVPDEIFGIKTFNMGGAGAALSLFISNLILHLFYRFNSKKLSKTGFKLNNISIIVFSTILNLIFYLLIKSHINNSLIIIAIALLLNYPIYFIILSLTNIILKEDLKTMFNFFNIIKLKNYITTEISKRD